MAETLDNLIVSLEGVTPVLELQVREWIVASLKAYADMPEELAARISEGLSESVLTAAQVRVVTNGATGDEDTSDRTRYSVSVNVIVLFDWKAIPLATFKAAASVVSRAIRSLSFEVAFEDVDENGTFYWLPNVSGVETDVVTLDSPYWDSQAGRTYNNSEFSFNLFFLRSAKVPTGTPIHNQP